MEAGGLLHGRYRCGLCKEWLPTPDARYSEEPQTAVRGGARVSLGVISREAIGAVVKSATKGSSR